MTMRMSLLSTRVQNTSRIRPGGRIRPGIKLLGKDAKKNADAVKIYNDGLNERLKFDEIEKRITKKTGIQYPLYPKNTSYFNVATADFGIPELAFQLVEKYGEKRQGDTKKHLYRFPVVFHTDDLFEIFPNRYKCFGEGPSFESYYREEDGERWCRYLPNVTPEMLKDQKIRRITRPPRREHVDRGPCEPKTCPQALSGQCSFQGTLHFYIPGINTTSLVAMEMGSEYAAEDVWSDLQLIRDMLGTLPRFNPDSPGQPIFWITKKEEPRAYFDEHGVRKTANQWVPKVQADLDIARLLESSTRPALAAPATTPVTWLKAPETAQVPMTAAHPEQANPNEGYVLEGQQVVSVLDRLYEQVDSLGIDEQLANAYLDVKFGAGWDQDEETTGKAIALFLKLAKLGDVCCKKLVWIAVATNQLGVIPAEMHKYAVKQYGGDYHAKEHIMNRIEQEVLEWRKHSPEKAIKIIRDALQGYMEPA